MANICPQCEDKVVKGIEFDHCSNWFHQDCAGLSTGDFKLLSKLNPSICWYCSSCQKSANKLKKPDADSKLDSIITMLVDMSNRIVSIEAQNATQNARIDNRIDTKVEEAVKEAMDRERRKLNLIIHGLTEINCTDTSERKQQEEEQVKAVLAAVQPDSPTYPSDIMRLGERKEKQSETYENNVRIDNHKEKYSLQIQNPQCD
jgi:hypothetical protein